VATNAACGSAASPGARDLPEGHRSTTAGARAQRRLAGLDGVRGLAALFVVLNHIFLRAFPGYPVNRAPFWAAWFGYGRFAVVVFIVLSGFSLALSPARHGWHLDGLGRFAQRRAWRILPAYWAALVFSLVVAWAIVPPPGQDAPDVKSVVVNGLLLQNLVGAPSPNRAFWSIALEVQLYVAFPLLLLVIRRVNALAMVAAVTFVVAAVGVVGPQFPWASTLVTQSPPDLAALFALGIVLAGIVRAKQVRRSSRTWPSLPWAWLSLAAVAPVLATIRWQGSGWTLEHLLWVDLALGPAIACLIAALAVNRPTSLVRALDVRPLRSLGLFSYSLYLTHAPIVVVLYEKVVAGRVRQGAPSFLLAVAVVVPATLVFARLFAAVFETPFVSQRGRPALWARSPAVATMLSPRGTARRGRSGAGPRHRSGEPPRGPRADAGSTETDRHRRTAGPVSHRRRTVPRPAAAHRPGHR
jgi:peptidoglycan/LPS O-acetylase OafA/YrhL